MDTFGAAPKTWNQWLIPPRSLASALRVFLSEVEREVGRTGGQPDIVAWRGNSLAETLFIEYKGPADRIRQTQAKWVQEAFKAGFPRDQLAIARWPNNRGGAGAKPNTTHLGSTRCGVVRTKINYFQAYNSSPPRSLRVQRTRLTKNFLSISDATILLLTFLL